jgi:hypothetical protein
MRTGRYDDLLPCVAQNISRRNDGPRHRPISFEGVALSTVDVE